MPRQEDHDFEAGLGDRMNLKPGQAIKGDLKNSKQRTNMGSGFFG